VEKSKKNYLSITVLSCKNDSKKMWKFNNNLLGSKAKELYHQEKLMESVNLTFTCKH